MSTFDPKRTLLVVRKVRAKGSRIARVGVAQPNCSTWPRRSAARPARRDRPLRAAGEDARHVRRALPWANVIDSPMIEPLESFETWLMIWTAANLVSLREDDR